MFERSLVFALIAWMFFLATAGPSHAASYDPKYTRDKAAAYAWHGLRERYTFGGSKFINNDRWDPACTYSCSSTQEGTDCSGFAAKVLAVPYLTSEKTVYHPYPTYAFYNVGADGYGPVGSYPYSGGRFWFSAGDRLHPYWMNLFVWDKAHGGPSDHMGVLRGRNSDGTWMTREARGKDWGVVQLNRKLGDLIRWNYKRVQRTSWGS
jgi:hypothetical protein